MLAKLLHRKRPKLIPLYDERVRDVYQGGPTPVLPPEKGRSWAAFMAAFAGAVQRDLRREAQTWREIARLARDPPITELRALDIVAWWAGGQTSARPARRAAGGGTEQQRAGQVASVIGQAS